MPASWHQAARLLGGVLLLPAAACGTGQPDGDSIHPQEATPGYCAAVSRLEVGAPQPTPAERVQILDEMQRSAPRRWRPAILAAIESVRTGHDMSPIWNTTLQKLTAFSESACGINLPQFRGDG